MLDLIKYIVGQFAEDKENVEYIVNEKEHVIEVSVVLSPSDMGKVIGKQGKIAKAMRTIEICERGSETKDVDAE